MKIFGIYRTSAGDNWLTEPLYMHIQDAIKAAEDIVKKEQKEVLEARKAGSRFPYEDWTKVRDHVWEGGVKGYGDNIYIDTLDLIK